MKLKVSVGDLLLILITSLATVTLEDGRKKFNLICPKEPAAKRIVKNFLRRFFEI